MASSKDLRIIGIDVATDAKKVGLSLCELREQGPRVSELALGQAWPEIDRKVLQWADGPTLLALDAPLGWPRPLSESLHAHRAGAPLEAEANEIFRRTTDDVVAKELGKRPLDVGADRIARTAHAALSLLARLSERLGARIPLAWSAEAIDGVSAIEVYPAGTLTSRALPHSGYKGSSERAASLRKRLVEAIGKELSIEASHAKLMLKSDHALDAALCGLAAVDFIAGDVILPGDLELAKHEGWIWVRAHRNHD